MYNLHVRLLNIYDFDSLLRIYLCCMEVRVEAFFIVVPSVFVRYKSICCYSYCLVEQVRYTVVLVLDRQHKVHIFVCGIDKFYPALSFSSYASTKSFAHILCYSPLQIRIYTCVPCISTMCAL